MINKCLLNVFCPLLYCLLTHSVFQAQQSLHHHQSSMVSGWEVPVVRGAGEVAKKVGILGFIENRADSGWNNRKYFYDAASAVNTLVSYASQLLDNCPADGGFEEPLFDWLDGVMQLIRDFKSSGIAKKIPGNWTSVEENIKWFASKDRNKPEGYTAVVSVSNWREHISRTRGTSFKGIHIGQNSKNFLTLAEKLNGRYQTFMKDTVTGKTLFRMKPPPYLPPQKEMNTLVSIASQLLDQCPKDRGFDESSFDWFCRVMQLIDKFDDKQIVMQIPASWSSARASIRQFSENGRYKAETYTAASSAANSQPLVPRKGASQYEIDQKSKELGSDAEKLMVEYNEKWKKDYDANTLFKKKPGPKLPEQEKINTLVCTASNLLKHCPVDSGFDDVTFDWLRRVRQLINDFESSGIAREIPRGWSGLRGNITQFSKNSMYRPEEYAPVDCGLIYHSLSRKSDAKDKEIEGNLELFSTRAERLKKEYDEMEHKGNTLFKKRPRCKLPDENNGVEFIEFKCREEIMKKVFRSIDDNASRITLIYGPGGIGKTTILAEVAKKAQMDVRRMFSAVVYAKVSRNPAANVRAIQETIEKQLGMSRQPESRTERSKELENKINELSSSKIENEFQKVLVILDDVWEDDRIMTKIGIPSNSRVKVLIGTRRRDLSMGEDNKIQIDLLREEDSWLLLQQVAPEAGQRDSAEKIQAECCGLPLALSVIGRALAGKEERAWQRAVDCLKNSKPINLEGVEANLYKIIKYSYDHLPLPNKISRKVFLYCSLFPESEQIHEVDLQRHLDEAGDVKSSLAEEENGDLTMKVADSVDTLVHYGLLQKPIATRGIVNMHDVVRDAAVFIARQEEYAFIDCSGSQKMNFSKTTMRKCKRMSLSNINKALDTPDWPKLQTLLIRGNTALPDLFSKKLESSLAVLDLSHSGMSTLPPSMKNLKNVRTLLLNGCKRLSNVDVIVKLTGLQVLSLRESVVNLLPKNMKDLLNLIVLDWENSLPPKDTDPKVTQQHITEICKLQELSMYSKSITDAAFLEITKLKHLTAVKLYVTNSALKSAGVFAGENPCNWDKFTIYNHSDSPKLSEKKNLNLSIKDLQEVSHGVQVLLRKAEEVVMNNCFQNATRYEQSTNSAAETGLILTEATGKGTLEKTSILRVTDCANISYLTSNSGVPLTELEEIELSGLKILVGIIKPHEGAATDIFGKVRKITVNSCPKIKCVLHKDVLQKVHKTLKLIIVRHSMKVESIFQSETDCSASFSMLTSIELDDLQRLSCIWQGVQPPETFQNLKELFVRKCNMLTSLFTTHVAAQLKNLQKLTVEDNSGLTEIVSTQGAIVALSEQAFPRVTHLSLQQLPQLKHFSSSDINFDWPALVRLKLGACPALTGLPIGQESAPRMNIIDLDSSDDLKRYKQLKNQENLERFNIW